MNILRIAAIGLASGVVSGLAACANTGDVPEVTAERASMLDVRVAEVLDRHDVRTAGVGIIRNGELAWTGYYGEEQPGEPASAETLFNVASITKVVTAETILRLADAGHLSLDEPMAPHWVDPDIADDPRHELLTPRMALNHTTGFPNWRFLLPDRKLRFLHDPGTTYGYSGEGYEYLATFAEKKLERNFGELVREQVLDPVGIPDAAYSIRKETFEHLAQARDADGKFHGHYCRPNGWCRKEGSYSAADDMAITVEDYATFMIAVMEGEGYGPQLAADRNRVQAEKADQAVVMCDEVAPELCPESQGYGLGWQVLDYGDEKVLTHGGSDWSELALSYFYTDSKDGIVVFFNVSSVDGLLAMSEVVELLDPDSPLTNLYERWYAKAKAQSSGD